MDRLSELQAQVNGAKALGSESSTFLVSDVELALKLTEGLRKVVELLDSIIRTTQDSHSPSQRFEWIIERANKAKEILNERVK